MDNLIRIILEYAAKKTSAVKEQTVDLLISLLSIFLTERNNKENKKK